MKKIAIKFFGSLEYFLPGQKRGRELELSFYGRRSIKDVIESFGIPHTEVGIMLVNKTSRDFAYILENKDKIFVYPNSDNYLVSDNTGLGTNKDKDIAFLGDLHLGKLVKSMRLLGLDVEFAGSRSDRELAEISANKGKILLTRDRQLLMRRNVTCGFFIRSVNVKYQVKDVLEHFKLKGICKPFSRCITCNGLLKQIKKREAQFEDIVNRIPPKVLTWCDDYNLCDQCEKIYWPGSHFKRLSALVESYLSD